MIQYLVIIGALANLLGSSVYVRDTILGRSQPNRVTFLLWALAPLIATVASLSAGVTWAVLPVCMSAFCPFLIFVATFVNRRAYWKLSLFDYVCGGLSLLALVLWALTREPGIAVIFAILSDGLAALPTLIKAWKYPETETLWGYVGAAFSGAMGVVASTSWSIVSVAFPMYLFVVCTAIALGVSQRYVRRAQHS